MNETKQNTNQELPLDSPNLFTRRHFLQTTAALGSLAGATPSLLWARSEETSANDISPITNCWGKAKTTVVDVEHVLVFRGYEGQSYSHEPQLTSHNGKLLPTWSLGLRNEESPGQRMVLSISEDQGRSWTKPITIAPSHKGQFADSMLVGSGIHVHGDTLVAYYAEYECSSEALNPDGTRKDTGGFLNLRTEARVSRDGGLTWSDPLPIMRNFQNAKPPVATKSGRLIFPGNYTYPYTDDPAGLTGWKRVGIAGVPDDYFDCNAYGSGGAKLIGSSEPFSEASSFYQTDDSVIHMMLRNNNIRAKRLGVTESSDDGLTWSKPRLTGYTDSICRSSFGRLPDGRFYGISCPDPIRGGRTPVVLATSHDGIVFDRHYVLGSEPRTQPRIPGNHKGGRYGSPYLHVMEDMAFMIYSQEKEDIFVGRFPLSAIREGD